MFDVALNFLEEQHIPFLSPMSKDSQVSSSHIRYSFIMQTIQDKLNKAEEYKSAGNEFFKEGNFSRAKSNYGKWYVIDLAEQITLHHLRLTQMSVSYLHILV